MPDIKFPTYSTQKAGKKKQAKVVTPKGMRMVDTQPAARRHQQNQNVRMSFSLSHHHAQRRPHKLLSCIHVQPFRAFSNALLQPLPRPLRRSIRRNCATLRGHAAGMGQWLNQLVTHAFQNI